MEYLDFCGEQFGEQILRCRDAHIDAGIYQAHPCTRRIPLEPHYRLLVEGIYGTCCHPRSEHHPQDRSSIVDLVVAALISLFIAQFLLWDHVRKERDQLRRYNVAQATLNQLAEFRGQLVEMQNENVTDVSEFGAWRQRYSDLRERIRQYIEANISNAEARLYETLGNYDVIVIAGKGYVSDEHINFTSRVIRDHKWLDKAIQDYGRQRFRPGLTSEE